MLENNVLPNLTRSHPVWLSADRAPSCKHVPRLANRFAHELASRSLSSGSVIVLSRGFPRCVLDFAKLDA